LRLRDIAGPEFQLSDEEADKIRHIALPIRENHLLANDVPESMGRVNENENRSKISVSADSRAEADSLFIGLSAGGSIEVSMSDSPWRSYFGMFRDKFGIGWIVEFNPKNEERE
jgi:PhnB protein